MHGFYYVFQATVLCLLLFDSEPPHKPKPLPVTQREESQEKRKGSRERGVDSMPTTTKNQKLGLLFLSVP